MPRSALYSLFMQAPALICVLRGPDHVFDLVNPFYQRLFPSRELLGKPIREALPELEGQGFFELLDGVYSSGQPFFGNEVPAMLDRTGSGKLEQCFFNFVYQPMEVDDHGQRDGVMVFAFEITEQVVARRQANLLADDLRKANREKDEFIAVVAHELRTPMTSILGWVRLLRLGDLDQDTHATALESLERSTKAQAKIIEDLLDESRISSGKLRLEMRPVSLGPIVEAAAEMMRQAAEAKRTIILCKVPEEPLQMFGDPNRLQQVIANVLANAIKFSPEESHVEIRLRKAGIFAEVEVRDHGRGIPPELLPHIFDRFRQGGMAEKQGGLGLGLAIARHLIELQGGTISAASEGEAMGAVFTMRLPLDADGDASGFIERENNRGWSLPALKGVHALIVEDDIGNRDVIAAVMRRCGATVDCVGTAAEGFQRIEQRRPHVIIADIVLPDLDGCAFLEQLRKSGHSSRRDIPALALTVFGRPGEQERILAAGFNVLRQKPVEPADLANDVARLVGRS